MTPQQEKAARERAGYGTTINWEKSEHARDLLDHWLTARDVEMPGNGAVNVTNHSLDPDTQALWRYELFNEISEMVVALRHLYDRECAHDWPWSNLIAQVDEYYAHDKKEAAFDAGT